MIPLSLHLENFFNYQQLRLDLSGIHTACLFGPNGAGKSALFEAMTWALWGQCRCPREEDIIRSGATLTQVELIYHSHQERFRVLRTRQLSGGGALEWHLHTPHGWRSLTRKTMRATQAGIEAQLGLDYETFVNSVYLRQGRADEFVVKRPAERKRILSDILRLDAYQPLAEQSREASRRLRLRLDWVTAQLQDLQDIPHRLEECQAEEDRLRRHLESLQAQQHQDEQTLTRLQQQHQQQQYVEKLRQTLTAAEQQWRQQQQYLEDLRDLLRQRHEIEVGYQQHLALVQTEQEWHHRCQEQQHLRQTLASLEAEIVPWEEERRQRHQELQQRYALLQAQIQEDQSHLQDLPQVESAYQTYCQARRHLQEQLSRYHRAMPLLRQRQERQQAVAAQRAQWQARQALLQRQLEEGDPQAPAVLTQRHQQLATLIADLERQKVYYQRLQEKIQARRTLVDQLQERQRILQRQCHWLQQEERLLNEPQVSQGSRCPLCEQALTPELRARLLTKHKQHYTQVEEDLLVIREQLAVADREIALFQSEARSLEQALAQLDQHRQVQGRLEAQLEAQTQYQQQRQQWQAELVALTQALEGDPSEAWQDLESQLAALGYNEAEHSLWRSEVERWRWAAGRWHDLQKRRQRQQQQHHQAQILAEQIQALQQPDPQLQPLWDERQRVLRALESLVYDPQQHQELRERLRQSHAWVERYRTLQQAEAHLPHVEAHCQASHQRWQQQHQEYRHLLSQLPPDPIRLEQLEALQTGIRQRRLAIDQTLAALGANQQLQEHLRQQQATLTALQAEHQTLRRQQQVYQELAYAFGPNGIPSLIIENVLPELEALANQILSRLTQHQLHLHFSTQRSSKRSAKPIDTLDILIADSHGTRPYETYSGGEAFRINFAIRLALSTLLMQRSGSRLQTLLIDEGFGSQDPQGRQALVAAINAIAPDFARILVITHIPSLRDAFPQRLEVRLTPQGSQVEVIR